MKTNQISNYLLLIAILSLSVLFLGAEGNGCFDPDPDPEQACYDDSDCANGEICESGECIEAICERESGSYVSPYNGECIYFEDGCDVPPNWLNCEIYPPLDCVDLDEIECMNTDGCRPIYEEEMFDPQPCGDTQPYDPDGDGDPDENLIDCAPIAPWFLYCEEEIIPEGCETLSEEQCWNTPECEWIWADMMPCYCEDGDYCDCLIEPAGQCVEAIWPETCEQYTEWECWDHPECEPIYEAAACYCEDDWCACPDVEEFVWCADKMPQDCEYLSEDECWSNSECEWVWTDAMPCYCDGDDYCNCEFIPTGYCVEAYYPTPCEELSEGECWSNPECTWEWLGTPCWCGDDEDCDCPIDDAVGYCVENYYPAPCEELTEYECESNPECHLEYFDCFCYDDELCDCAPNAFCVSNDPVPPPSDCEYLSPYECEEFPGCQLSWEYDCDCFGEDDYCDCYEEPVCITIPEPEGCYGLSMDECEMADGCVYEFFDGLWCGDPDCEETGQCVPNNVPQDPCEELNERECYEFSGCEPTYTSENCACYMYCEANDPNCCECEAEFDICVAI